MKAHAPQQKQPQRAASPDISRRVLHAAGERALTESPQAGAGGLAAGFGPAATNGFAHDFSRIPVSPGAPVRLQAKLRVNTPGDIYEQEADRVSEQLMRGPETRLRPACACGGGCAQCRAEQPERNHERLQTKRVQAGDTGHAAAPPVVHEVLAAHGQPLDLATRAVMEPRFGQDFGHVRVHTGAKAAESASALNSLAYTAGRHVVFGAGQYAPGTDEGDRLLAHELTHTLQQGRGAPHTIQRALKFEFQTGNHVWAVKNSGAPDPRLLPRKYAPTTVGYKEGSGEERGDRPAYLSVGQKGGPAKKAGSTVFVEAEGPLVTEEARSGVDVTRDAQFVQEFRFKTQVKIEDIIDKPVARGRLVLVDEIDNAKIPAMSGNFNPNTFEFKYTNADGTPLDVHLNRKRHFKMGHVRLMRVGRGERKGIDEAKEAQFIEIWKVTEVPTGGVDFMGRRAKVERVSVVNNAKDRRMRGLFNPNTWEKKYFMAADFTGGAPSEFATPLDVHMDAEGRLRSGQVKFMVKEKLAEAKEQTAIELQSETGGVLEFETPQWFRRWPELEERIQEAVDMTDAINNQRGTPEEVTDANVLNAIDAKKPASVPLGRVVKWPEAFGTAHLTKLRADKRKLLVQIVDDSWSARIQASEAIALSEYGSFMGEHEEPWVKDIVTPGADAVFNKAFAAAKLTKSTLNENLFSELRGFLQLIVNYVVRGQVLDMTGHISKATFMLMARTNFGSMYKELLSDDEKALFKTIVGDPRNASDNPLLTELEPLINAERGRRSLPALTLTRKTRFFFKKVGTHKGKETFGPPIYDWLLGMTKGRDLLSGPGISDAMGAKSVQNKPGGKDFKRAQFEVRGTVAHGGAVSSSGRALRFGNDKPASLWVSYAKEIFEAAMGRAADTPDNPATPKEDETSRTGLRK
jgi:hypothetical protein